MEFWGVEVPVDAPLKCLPGDDKYIHLSQVCLGEFKKSSSVSVPVYVTVDDKKFVIGTLTPGSCNQISLDLVFEKEIQFSHGWKDGSVFLSGYKTINAIDDDMEDFCSSESDSEDDVEAVPLDNKPANGNADGMAEKPVATVKAKAKTNAEASKAKANAEASKAKANAEASKAKANAEASKAKGKVPVVPKEDEKDDEDSDDSDDDFGEDDGDSDSEMIEQDDDSADESEDEDDDDEDEDDEDDSTDELEVEAAPKPQAGKKRPASSDAKASLPEKKAKTATPAGKLGGKVAQKGGGDKQTTPTKQQQTPKSAGSVSCKSCSKTFKSDASMQAHSKAKHG